MLIYEHCNEAGFLSQEETNISWYSLDAGSNSRKVFLIRRSIRLHKSQVNVFGWPIIDNESQEMIENSFEMRLQIQMESIIIESRMFCFKKVAT